MRNWFVQGLITNIVATILVAGAGVVIAVIAKTATGWLAPVLYGLAGSALLSVIILALMGIARLPRARRTTNTENVESLVRLWLDNFRFGVRNDPVQEALFRLIVTTDGGTRIIVGRPRGDLSGYVIIRSEIVFGAEDQRIIAALPTEQVNRTMEEIRLELARAKVGYSGLAQPLGTVALFKRIPIGDALTEDSLIARIEEIEAAFLSMAAIARINRIFTPAVPQGPIRG